MMGKRKGKTLTATLSLEGFEKIAADVVPGHRGWIEAGYRLTGKGRLWRCKNGSWTGRFVYRLPGEANFTVTNIVRGIIFSGDKASS